MELQLYPGIVQLTSFPVRVIVRQMHRETKEAGLAVVGEAQDTKMDPAADCDQSIQERMNMSAKHIFKSCRRCCLTEYRGQKSVQDRRRTQRLAVDERPEQHKGNDQRYPRRHLHLCRGRTPRSPRVWLLIMSTTTIAINH